MAEELNFFQYVFSNEMLFSLPGDQAAVGPPAGRTSEVQEGKPATVFRSLKTRVLILVNTYGKGIQPNEMAFLTKVLAAVKYSPETVDLLELDKIGTTDASEVLRDHLADYVLLFGVKPESLSLPVALELFEPRKENGVWMLMSNSLLRIEMEESKRRDLWNALKKVFL
ncbi:hypothetical protein GCM10023091_25060 [Ravibacter arvi]|uniref:Uncharacterized protein n=1 Tax=Ravibacter arvi TaxID=2051041 RepID=A0ABP8LZ21_9BACT